MNDDTAFQEELAARQGKAEPEPRSAKKSKGKTSAPRSKKSDPSESDTAEAPVVPPNEGGAEKPADASVPSVEAKVDGAGTPSDDGPAESPQAPVAEAVPSAEIVEVTAHPSIPQSAFRAMDRMDEVQIIEEIEGRMSEVLVYKVPGKGEDLSFAGVREAIRLLVEQTGRRINTGRHAPEDTIVEVNGEKVYRVKVYAEDEASGQGYWGTAEQPIRMKLKESTAKDYRKKGKHVYGDDTVDDEFAYTKALSKAQRNALKYFIPEQIRQGILAIAQKNPAKLREITMGTGAPRVDAPPALNDDEATELIKECKERYAALKREFPEFAQRVPPGKFNSDLRSSWSSHEALRTLRDNLVEAREALEKKAA